MLVRRRMKINAYAGGEKQKQTPAAASLVVANGLITGDKD